MIEIIDHKPCTVNHYVLKDKIKMMFEQELVKSSQKQNPQQTCLALPHLVNHYGLALHAQSQTKKHKYKINMCQLKNMVAVCDVHVGKKGGGCELTSLSAPKVCHRLCHYWW